MFQFILAPSEFWYGYIYRNNGEKRREFMLKDEDILRFGRVILPACNLTISKTRELFSGEPSMTLKVTINVLSVMFLKNFYCFGSASYMSLVVILVTGSSIFASGS